MSKGMQILTTANLAKVLDTLVEQPVWDLAMRSVGGRERTAFEWRAKCIKAMKDNDLSSPFWMEWRGVFDWWTSHCGRARAEHRISTEAVFRAQAKDGIEEKVYGPNQTPVWKENLRYLHRSDDYIRFSEGLDPEDDVEWYRYEHDAEGNPVQLTRVVQIAAPLRKAILTASHPDYKETLDVSVEHSGTVHVARPLQRLASEPRAGADELRRLSLMTPEQRREAIGASPYPKDAHGLRTIPQLSPPTEPSDHPREREEAAPPRPAYAKPVRPLDTGERIGRGEPPPGGMKMI
ncbi:MAG TPA: hypothetical protein VN742_09615 [Candidatus Binataceae bacterium]|nr:hypothetical protein [Candidatus Binataceae bacterium]